jgi:hypothetical protein
MRNLKINKNFKKFQSSNVKKTKRNLSEKDKSRQLNEKTNCLEIFQMEIVKWLKSFLKKKQNNSQQEKLMPLIEESAN